MLMILKLYLVNHCKATILVPRPICSLKQRFGLVFFLDRDGAD